MPLVRSLLVAVALFSAGCSAIVAGSGKQLDDITTQEQARQVFGAPTESGIEDGRPYDEFRTHRKISQSWKGIYYCMGSVCTLGLGEIIWLPKELFIASRQMVLGGTVRFVYTPDGGVTSATLDGHYIPGCCRPVTDPAHGDNSTGATVEDPSRPK